MHDCVLLLCLFLAPVFSTCSDCCLSSSCQLAFNGASGVCCGKQGGGFACCPTGAVCKQQSEGIAFTCYAQNQHSPYSTGGSSRSPYSTGSNASGLPSSLYILLMALLPLFCVSACIYGVFRMVSGRSSVGSTGTIPQPSSSTGGYHSGGYHSGGYQTGGYQTGTAGYAPHVQQQRGGYGTGSVLGAGALGALGGAALESAFDGRHRGGGGEFGGGASLGGDGGFAPAVDFPGRN